MLADQQDFTPTTPPPQRTVCRLSIVRWLWSMATANNWNWITVFKCILLQCLCRALPSSERRYERSCEKSLWKQAHAKHGNMSGAEASDSKCTNRKLSANHFWTWRPVPFFGHAFNLLCTTFGLSLCLSCWFVFTLYACVRVCESVCICVYVFMCVCVHVCAHVFLRLQTRWFRHKVEQCH